MAVASKYRGKNYRLFSTFQNNTIQLEEHQFLRFRMKGWICTMSAVDQLLKYIISLAPKQVDKVVTQLPRLTSLLGEQEKPSPQEQSSQNQ